MSNTIFRNGNMFCVNCGGEFKLTYPISAGDMAEKAEAFEKLHENCPKTWEQSEADPKLPLEDRAHWWMENGERGMSSEAIWNVMMETGEGKGTYPLNPDDFKRCRNLLKAVPEWRDELHRMKPLGFQWSNLVDLWPVLDAMYDRIEEDGVHDEMHELMKKITT